MREEEKILDENMSINRKTNIGGREYAKDGKALGWQCDENKKKV